MLKEDWLKLPEAVGMFIAVTAEEEARGIGSKFSLSIDQIYYILDCVDQLLLKQTDTLNLPNQLDKMPGAKNFDVRLLTLDIAYKILWPLQDYIGSVDKLIFRLGGKVPRIKPLKGQVQDTSKLFPGQGKGTLKEMLAKYEDFKDLRLSSNKIVDYRGYHLTATVDNWVKDYIHFVGVEGRDSLKRAQYLSKAKNPLGISQADRDSLRLLLVSYDENAPMSYDYSGLTLSVSELSEKKEEQKISLSPTLEENIRELGQRISKIEKNLIAGDFILSEAAGELPRVRDVLWDSLAMGDKDKIISCLKFLLEKKAFDLMLKEDNRFKNILKRFIGIRFGHSAENYLAQNPDILIVRRLFLEMIFSDKLRLPEAEAALLAYYLSNIVAGSGQLVYFDEPSGLLKWRQVESLGNKFSFSEMI